MLLGQLETSFPWGLLLLTDSGSEEEVPGWESSEVQVTHGETVGVLRVMHRDEGKVIVRVWDDSSAVVGEVAFRGLLNIGSGVLSISDALGAALLEVTTAPGPTDIAIYTDAATEPTRVDIVVTSAM